MQRLGDHSQAYPRGKIEVESRAGLPFLPLLKQKGDSGCQILSLLYVLSFYIYKQ